MSKQAKQPGFEKEHFRIPEEQRCRQNFPLPSQVQTRRVYQVEPISDTCWAYMKLLRERDKTKTVYDIDPYVEVYQFRENIYGFLMESLDGMGDVWMYLVVGPERALLVDTGFGLGDLKGLCDKLTGGKELYVVNTHCHFDHAYGNSQFDRIYCHEYEVPSMQALDEHLWDYLFEEGTGRCIWTEFDRADLIGFRPYEIVGCPDGYTFDLGGGHEVELVHLGGHTPGHAGYLDKKDKVFFAGDDIVSMRVGIGSVGPDNPCSACASVATMGAAMQRLAARMDEFDHVFSGHFVTDLENVAVQHMAEACARALYDPEHGWVSREETPRGIQYQTYVEGLGTLAYSDRTLGNR